MSNYSSTFGGAAKDAANSIILGADHDTEYDAIATMSATKANKTGAPATTNNLAMLTATGDLADSLVESDGSGNITANLTATDITTDTLTATTTNGDLAVTRNGTGDLTLDGAPLYGLVMLDTPEELVSNTSTSDTNWTTYDMSAGGTAAAAAAALGASKAILKIHTYIASSLSTSTGYINRSVFIAKSGQSGVPPSASSSVYAVQSAVANKTGTENVTIFDRTFTTTEVNLDSNSDFQYSIDNTVFTLSMDSTVTRIYLIGYYV